MVAWPPVGRMKVAQRQLLWIAGEMDVKAQ